MLTVFAFMNPVVNALMYVVVTVVLLVGSYEVGAGATTPGVIMAAISSSLLNRKTSPSVAVDALTAQAATS